MKETADSIAAMIPSLSTEMEFWCAAWALGRCGEAKHARTLNIITKRAQSVPWVLAMVAEARTALVPDDRPEVVFKKTLGAALDAGDAKVFWALTEQELRTKHINKTEQHNLILLTNHVK